jgi:hypothetical protein
VGNALVGIGRVDEGDSSPIAQGEAARGWGARALARRRTASGHQEAKASRMRLVVSCTRTAILSRRSCSVANSARASSRVAGMANRTASISQ